jgi:voltage-gated potassium channel
MHVLLWDFEARPGREAEFEHAYRPDGDWARLFAAGPEGAAGYRGTELLRDVEGSRRYLTIDRWTSVAAYDAFRAAAGESYTELDRQLQELTSRETPLGTFTPVSPESASAPAPSGAAQAPRGGAEAPVSPESDLSRASPAGDPLGRNAERLDTPPAGLRRRLHEIIFESDTPVGKAFDIALIFTILLSVAAVMLESVSSVRAVHGPQLRAAEWLFTLLFTGEYVLRLFSVGRPLRYATSFFGVVDLLAIVPTYLSLLLPGAQYLLVILLLRILRVFRVLKLVRYLSEADVLMRALRASRRKITVFIFTILTLVVVVGALMYLIEGEENGFTSIPRSVYWSIVTLTTVGYGDISPRTNLGQVLAAVIMLMGYGIIAVPTGIVTVELSRAYGGYEGGPFGASREDARRGYAGGTTGGLRGALAAVVSGQACPSCGAEGHHPDARYCRSCGAKL